MTYDYYGNYYADGLRKGCSQGCSGRSHFKKPDKDIVQDNITYAGNYNKVHGALGVPQSSENAAYDIVCRNKGYSYKTNSKISGGSLHSLRRS